MNTLAKEDCEACDKQAKLATPEERSQYMSDLDHWEIIQNDGLDQLKKVFTFEDFDTALTFTNKVGDLAETVGHHPAILTEWGKVTIRWWSHEAGGLHKNDFILAARCDQL